MDTCRGCGGYGRVRCPHCDGAGRSPLSISGSDGICRCKYCDGEGEVGCPLCIRAKVPDGATSEEVKINPPRFTGADKN